MMYNIPPKLSVAEMDVELVCPEVWFQARSSSEAIKHIRGSQKIPTRHATFSTVIALLCKDNIDPATHMYLAQVGELNLMILAEGMSDSILF